MPPLLSVKANLNANSDQKVIEFGGQGGVAFNIPPAEPSTTGGTISSDARLSMRSYETNPQLPVDPRLDRCPQLPHRNTLHHAIGKSKTKVPPECGVTRDQGRACGTNFGGGCPDGT